MIARQLVAGPSRVLARVRHASSSAENLSSSAASPLASSSLLSDANPSVPSAPQAPTSSSTRRDRLYSEQQYKELRPIQILMTLPRSEGSPVHQNTTTAARTWDLYANLAPATRRALPRRVLETVLRAVVPRFDDAAALSNVPAGRARLGANLKQARAAERKLRAVVTDMVAAGHRPALTDWTFVLKTLARLGHVAACEAVASEVPEALRAEPAVIEQRLGAVTRRARNMDATRAQPSAGEISRLVAVLWDIFGVLEKRDVVLRRPTLEMLITATQRVRATLRWLEDDAEAAARLDALFQYALAEGYGFDLATLVIEHSDVYAPITPRALNVILDYMRTKGESPYRLLAVFELLAARAVAWPAAADAAEAAEPEHERAEDEVVPTLSSLTAAEEAGAQRLDWLGRPKNRVESPSSFFDAATFAHAASAAPARSSAFLTPVPRPATLAPSTRPPERAAFNPTSVTHLLQSAASASDLPLALQILSGAVHATHAARAAWLAAYLGTPPGVPVPHPGVRVSPKWFAPVLALCARMYARSASRVEAIAEDALAWSKEERRVLVDHHAAAAAAAAEAASPPEAQSDAEAELSLTADAAEIFPARPVWAEHPRARRKLRSAGVLIASEHDAALVGEIAELEGVVERAQALRRRRTAWKAGQAERKAARRAEEAARAGAVSEGGAGETDGAAGSPVAREGRGARSTEQGVAEARTAFA